ncbi:adenosine deaminase 2-like isoform X1 [Ischnura elegans]|uniref:adenosine deaminase 2-like isoform X1 n=1 Tax=Ischnura elegans TaxID=197161 RepID=UPI001ED87455|nr:adenosine deaminase 2-like isoform X1 [Ischnura elegans]
MTAGDVRPRGRGMLRLWPVLTALLLLVVSRLSEASPSYWADRAKFLADEASKAVGSRISLTADEEVVNGLLMAAKRREISAGLSDASTFLPAKHFFEAKKDIEKSDVFRFIKDLPKGAALHGHDTSMASLAYVVNNLTHRADLYACVTPATTKGLSEVPLKLSALRFSAPGPPPISERCAEWTDVGQLRSRFGSDAIDRWFESYLSLVTANPREKYPNIDVVWEYFYRILDLVGGLVTYKPVFAEYYKRTLEEMRDDNVIYLELRGTLPKLYDLDGNQWEGSEVVKVYKEATDEFMENNRENFIGAKFIYNAPRLVNDSTADQQIQTMLDIHTKYPDFVAGFDIAGQEDKGRPLKDFVDRILTLPPSIKFFFHAGETDWQGLADMNLVDAVLLNTTRLGHGYAILKHPLVMQRVKEQGIAIEVNPISNQVLLLVNDLRNHPAAALLADDYPVVISCDNAMLWNSTALSYDFYEAFMGMTSADTDLRFLKRLAFNSIIYSSMNSVEKSQALFLWHTKWNQFISNTIEKYSYTSL